MRTAIHEAAHAVIFKAGGLYVEQVQVKREFGSYGSCSYSKIINTQVYGFDFERWAAVVQGSDETTKELVRSQVRGLLAGYIAAAIYHDEHDLYSDDEIEALALCSLLDADADGLRERLRAETEALVIEHHKRIHIVADALYCSQHKALSGEEIDLCLMCA